MSGNPTNRTLNDLQRTLNQEFTQLQIKELLSGSSSDLSDILAELETLNTVDFATETTLSNIDNNVDLALDYIGATNETPAGSDIADSGLNGLLKRISQRLTSLIALLPTSLGQKTMANSLAVTVASDQSTIPTSLVSGVISANNSSTATLLAGATFTGTADEVTNYASVAVLLTVDRSGTLYCDFSSDGTNWNHTEEYTITPTTPGTPDGFFFQYIAQGRYARIRYTNGGTNQGVMRLQTILRTIGGQSEVHAVGYPILSTTEALSVKGVFYGLSTSGGGAYVAVKVTPSGAINSAIGDISGIVGQQAKAASLPVTLASDDDLQGKIGALTESAPGTDTASSGLNGRLQRIAQRLTSLIALWYSQGSTTSGQVGPLVQGAVTTSAPTYSTGQTSPLSLTPEGRVRTQIDNSPTVFTRASPTSGSTGSLSRAATTAYATNLVVKASAGRLFSLIGYNSRTSAQFIQVHNTTSLPADTAVPIYFFRVEAQSNFSLTFDYADIAAYFSTGITVCNSSTGPTKTVGSADCWFVAEYI